MALVNQTLKLEITPGGVPPKLHVTEYDENMQIVAQLFQRGQYYEIPSGTTAKVEGTLDGHPFSADATVDGSNVIFELTKGMTAYAGRAWTKIKLTKDGKALYLHCLPADITGLSCPEGEVDNSVFDRYIVPLYKQASYKPYIIAAMMFLAQVKDPVRALMEMDKSGEERKMF